LQALLTLHDWLVVHFFALMQRNEPKKNQGCIKNAKNGFLTLKELKLAQHLRPALCSNSQFFLNAHKIHFLNAFFMRPEQNRWKDLMSFKLIGGISLNSQ
jgi:hypothetical protein